MRFEKVSLSEIPTDVPDAGKFSFSFEPEVGALANSIRDVGLVRPPLLRSEDGKLQVVCGLRRVLACKSLGWSEIDAFVYEAGELSDEKCLRLSLVDNDSPGRLSPVERAIALKKFSDAGYGINRLIAEVAPKLGLPPSRKYIEECLALPALDSEILRRVHDGSLGIEQAFCLLKLRAEEISPVFRILTSCRANLNETRELIALIPDVAAMKKLSLSEFIEGELARIVDDESTPPRKRLELLRDHLRRARYPRITEAESAFEKAVDEMKLGNRCRVTAPKHFEGDEVTITIKAKDTEQVEEILEKLSHAPTKQRLDNLFSMIRDPLSG